MVGSIEYTQTWKLKVTPSGRQYWAHTASERRIAVSASIGELQSWPTVTENCVTGPGGNREGGVNLQTAAEVASWPKTPMAGDAEGGVMEIQPEKDGKYKLRDYAMLSGWPTSQTMDAMNVCWESEERSAAANAGGCANLRERVMMAAWMTPKATDGSHGGPNQTGGELPPDACAAAWPTILSSECRQGYQDRTRGKKGAQESLSTIIQTAGWPTAEARDWKDGLESNEPINCYLGRQVWQVFLPGPATGSSTVGTKKSEGFRLNPYFSAWLMGFPRVWTLARLVAYRRLEASRSPRKKRVVPCC